MVACVHKKRNAHLSEYLNLMALALPAGERDNFIFVQEHQNCHYVLSLFLARAGVGPLGIESVELA